MKRLLSIVSSLDMGGAETFMMKIFRNLPEKYKIEVISISYKLKQCTYLNT